MTLECLDVASSMKWNKFMSSFINQATINVHFINMKFCAKNQARIVAKGGWYIVRNFLVFRFSFTLSVLNATLYLCPITQQNLTNCESWTCEIWSSRKALLLLCFVAHFDDKKCRAFCNFKSHFLTLNQQLFSKSVKGKSILLLNWPRKKYINVHKRIACLVKCEN